MQTKKLTTRLLALLLCLVLVLSACGKQPADPTGSSGPGQFDPTEPSQTDGATEPGPTEPGPTEPGPGQEATGLIDFSSVGHADAFEVDETAHTLTIRKVGGDHMAVYNGLQEPSLAFVFEADVMFPDGPNSGIRSAALTFGLKDKNNPFAAWYGANLDSNKLNENNLFRVFAVGGVPGFETLEGGERGDINIDEPLHLKLEMKRNGKFTYSFGNVGKELRSFTGVVPGWAGGYVGILAWESSAVFSNVHFESLESVGAGGPVDWSAPEEGDDNPVQTGLTDFSSSVDPSLIEIDKAAGTVTVGNSHGDHFAIFNGLGAPTDSFVFEADVTLLEANEPGAGISGALIFGIETKDIPGWTWNGANFDTGREDPTKFRVFSVGGSGGVNTTEGGEQGDIDFSKPLHLKLEVRRSGAFMYSFGNVGEELTRSITGVVHNWEGGYLGILSFNSKVQFSNITLKDRSSGAAGGETAGTTVSGEGFSTNLGNLTAFGGSWTVGANGLTANTADAGNCFVYSNTTASDFVFSTDVTVTDTEGTVSLVFRNQSATNHSNAYALVLDLGFETARVMRWDNDRKVQLTGDRDVGKAADGKYTLKVVSIGSWMSCYVNDKLVASIGDYIFGNPGGQNTVPESGSFGLQCSGCTAVFQNTKFTALTDENTPILKDITVASSVGDVEKKAQLFSTSPVYIQYVKNNAEKVDLNVTPVSSGASVTVTGPDGTVYPNGKGIPVSEGKSILTVDVVTTAADGTKIPVTYRVVILRRQAESVYYNEPYRDQYHYSTKDWWANDPNGLVYYNGTYHLFYQFATSTVWNTMHWAHATSTDLIHWEEQPIAFVPDANGVEYSGCIVADNTNVSGLFSTDKGGLIAFITADGNGQRMQLAYSEDEGVTWTKLNRIVADWSNDPLHDQAFRDPKVFRWENTWFMVVAGGPLRIYSSKNLVDWTCESTYGWINTECPDLYPVVASDGHIKWVLSRGGRAYKIGDFKKVDGKWTFIPDKEYEGGVDGVMNFGRDSYAAMTFYIQDFGTAAKPTIPDIMEINWMNTWDYCNEVANVVGQNFNGTFNMILKMGVVKEDGKYVLTQVPVSAYESLRNEKVVDLKGAKVGAENDVLAGLKSDTYEIVATFKPGANTTKVGFRLRENGDQYTEVMYDVKNLTLSVDRSKSGIQVGNFAEGGRIAVKPNANGTIDIHIFVDRSSVEVFAKGGIAAGADMIFPGAESLGATLVVEGDAVTADITVYTLNSIWH